MLLDRIEQELPGGSLLCPLDAIFRKLDAIAEMARKRHQSKAGCIIGNLSTELSGTHEAFRVRLAECFEEMAQEFVPHLEVAVRGRRIKPSAQELARYIVTVIEGAIMQSRTRRDVMVLDVQFGALKEHLKKMLNS